MNISTRLTLNYVLLWRGLFAAVFSVVRCSQLRADKGYGITGCVTDGAGRPLAHAKVVAKQVGGQHTDRAEPIPSTGCYEMTISSPGITLVRSWWRWYAVCT